MGQLSNRDLFFRHNLKFKDTSVTSHPTPRAVEYITPRGFKGSILG